MDKIKKFIDCYIPVCNCNLKCNYCYISTWESFKQIENSKKIEFSPELIRKALSKKRWGGSLMLNFCAAGETLLCNELIPIVEQLLEEGHYCMIVTNGTITPKFKKLTELPQESRNKLFIKFSYHYLELKRLNLLDVFFENVNRMKDAGISYTVEVTPSDEYIPYIEEIKQTCLERVGALPHITVCRIENGDVPLMSKLEKEEFKVLEVKKGERVKKGSLPFTTSTMQQEASKALNFPISKTMRIAQQLYEGVDIKGEGTVGLITYLRTDSVRISEEAEEQAVKYISETYGEQYLSGQVNAKKSSAKIQDAHEAIRPSDINRTPAMVKDSLT